MLCLSGFELYSRWVPLIVSLYFFLLSIAITKITRLQSQTKVVGRLYNLTVVHFNPEKESFLFC